MVYVNRGYVKIDLGRRFGTTGRLIIPGRFKVLKIKEKILGAGPPGGR